MNEKWSQEEIFIKFFNDDIFLLSNCQNGFYPGLLYPPSPLPPNFYYLSLCFLLQRALTLSFDELFIFSISHSFRVRLCFKFIIWFHFRSSFHFSIHSMIAFFPFIRSNTAIAASKRGSVVAIVLPFDFSMFQIQIQQHINAFGCADASHWVYGKTNWK